MKIAITSDTHRGFSQKTHEIHDEFGKRLAMEDYDVLILAGDIASHKQDQFEAALKFYRNVVGDGGEIYFVHGNHDLWGKTERDLETVLAKHNAWFEKYDIVHLHDCPATFNDTVFVGWDGWYGTYPHHSNDFNWMPRSGAEDGQHGFLTRHCEKGFQRALDFAEENAGRTVVAISHWPIVEKIPALRGGRIHEGNHHFFELLAPHIDILVQGHSHQAVHEVVDDVLVVNCGSDYDRPKYVILEVDSAGAV